MSCFDHVRLHAGSAQFTDPKSGKRTSEIHATFTGTDTVTGSGRGCVLLDKLKLKPYTVRPDSKWHLTASHLQEKLAWSSRFCPSDKLAHWGLKSVCLTDMFFFCFVFFTCEVNHLCMYPHSVAKIPTGPSLATAVPTDLSSQKSTIECHETDWTSPFSC